MSIFRAHGFISLALLATICGGIPWVQAETVSQITLNDFVNPRVLDFENVSDGLISITASLFTDFGFSAINDTFTFNVTDTYNVDTTSGRALFASFSGIFLDSPNGSQPQFGTTEWRLFLARKHRRFGVSFADLVSTDVTIKFFNGGNAEFLELGDEVGSVTFPYPGGSGEIFYFENTELFSAISISIDISETADGYGIDNLTLDTIPVPAPSGLFDAHQTFTTDPSPAALTIANLDGKDGFDLAVSSVTQAKITALLKGVLRPGYHVWGRCV